MAVTIIDLLQLSVGGGVHRFSEDLDRVDTSDVLVSVVRHDEDLDKRRK
jgi:hypothetical protein